MTRHIFTIASKFISFRFYFLNIISLITFILLVYNKFDLLRKIYFNYFDRFLKFMLIYLSSLKIAKKNLKLNAFPNSS